MAEYIEREALIAAFYKDAERCGDPEVPWDLSAIETEIECAPAADVAPVVRCKDCKRSKNAFDGLFCDHALPTKRLEEIIFCGTTVLSRVKPDDFCSYGERKDGEG